jgi:phosphoribosylaminoimidazole (AIR) synthetase
MSKEEMMRVFNCGYGMMFVFKKDTIITEEEFESLGEII